MENKKMDKKITFRLQKKMHASLVTLAKNRKVPISSLMREIVSESENIIQHLQDQTNIFKNEIKKLQGTIEEKNQEIQQLKSR